MPLGDMTLSVTLSEATDPVLIRELVRYVASHKASCTIAEGANGFLQKNVESIGLGKLVEEYDVTLVDLHVCQEVAQRWVRSGQKGKIVFTGTWVQDVPYKLIAPYCVSKAGVWMLCRCAALELAPYGITVNAVAPGIVDAGLTARELREFPEFREEFMNLIPLGRIQTAEDVAEVMGFLVSSASDYLTGTCIMADGGCMVGAASAPK